MQNIVIISGPAGSGKDAVVEGLRGRIPFERVINCTTRAPRPGEQEGQPYHFLSRQDFAERIAAGDFIEHSVNENDEMYGVTKAEIERVAKLPTLVLWKMDWKGVVSAKKLFPEIQAVLITAPLSVLEARLRRRDGAVQDEKYFEERMNYTREWMKHTDIYDYIIENPEGKLEETIEAFRRLVERLMDGSAPRL